MKSVRFTNTLVFVLALALSACITPTAPTPQIIVIPATAPPTQTPFVQVVTATPPPATQTPYVLVVTATPEAPIAQPTAIPMQMPTSIPPSPLPSESDAFVSGEIVLQDHFDASPAQALFGSQHMTFVSENGQGVLTGHTPKVVLPAMYNEIALRDFEAAFDLIPPQIPSDSSYGLLFRSDDARGGLAHYYMVVLNGKTNRVGFAVFMHDEFPRYDTENFLPGLWQAGKTNRVRVQAAENLVNVFLNDALIYSAPDALLPNAGYIGLAMLTGETVPDTVRFDNLTITATDVTRIAIAPTATNILPTATRPMATATPTKTRVPPTATRAPEASQPCPNPPRSLYWSDDFSNPNSGWMNFQGADYNHFYKDGEWHFAVSAKNETGTAWMLLRERTLHQAITVRAWRLGEPPMNSYGIIFGGQDNENYYAFRISDSGSFRLSRVIQNQWHDLIPWTKTAAIWQGGLNELAVLLDGAQIYACVNGQIVGTANDTALHPGRVGMIAGAYDEPSHIHFDDFAVWNLQGPVTLNQNASASSAPTQPAVNAPPGIYVTALRTLPDNPKRNQDVSFKATFLNTTGAAQNLDWLVVVYQPDAKKAFGETAAQRITVPPGVSEFTSASNWAVRGPGGCIQLYGVPHMQNPNSSRTPLNQPNGNAARIDFSVCP
jgi:hypothetical protein